MGKKSMPSTPLGRLRRYQDLLLLGGGVVITFVAFLTFAVTCVYALRQFAAEQRQNLVDDRGQVVTVVRAAQTSLRRTVSFFELYWPTMPKADLTVYDAFRRNGNQLFIEGPGLGGGVYFAASERAVANESLVRQYLSLARQFALSNASATSATNLEFAGYIYTPDEELIIMPASIMKSKAPPRVTEIIEALKIDFAKLAPQEQRRPPDFRPVVHWLPPFTDPLSGQKRLRLVAEAVSEGQPFAAIVIEYDPQTFLRLLTDRGNDTYQIVSADGRVIASVGIGADDRRLTQVAFGQQVRRPLFFSGDVSYGNGYFVMKEPIPGTDWTLISAFSWSDIVAAIAPQVGTAAAATAVMLAVVWTLLLVFRSRIFAPLLKYAARVFESEHLSRTVVHTVPVGLALISRETGEWLLNSPYIQEMGSRVVGESKALADALLRSYDTFEHDHPAGAPAGVLRQDLIFPTRDGGEIEFACSASQGRFNGIDVLVAVFIDVTQTRRLQRELKAAMVAADSANQAKSAFLAAMSHEIRTPLNAILGNLELLANSPLTTVQRDRLTTVRTASDGLLAVVSDILDYSKIEAGEMVLEHIEFNVLEVIERVLGIFEPLASARGLSLYARLDVATTQMMRGDPTRVAQVLNNLLSNAIKFTEHGAVTVFANIEPATVDTHRLILAVVDTGIGISPQQRDQLFKAFSQLDVSINRRFGGTGLGLALCQRIVRALQGRIGVSSTLHVGSRFTVQLPLGDGIPVRSDARITDGARVLFLSSALEWCDFAVGHLERWGAQVSVYRHPAAITEADLESAAVLVIWGTREQWRPDDENRLVESAPYVVDGYPDGPAVAVRTGKIVSVSCLSLTGLEASMRATLLGEPLPTSLAAASGLPRTYTSALTRGLKVLVAEDNAANRMLLTEQLTTLGCEVSAAPNGRQALELLDDDDWDVLLTDLNMPGMSGYQLAEAVRKRKPALRIIAVTAHATKEEHQRCEAAGMDQVMTKPVSLQQLNDVMESIAAAKGVKLTSFTSADEATFRGGAIPKPLWDVFLKSTSDALSAMDAAQAAGDVAGTLAQIHSMRGALSVFGQASLAADCARLEAEIKRDMSAPLPDELNVLKRALQDLLNAQV
ncbi:hybrid sensor histidine kinase/response regulator [Paraburkholderia dinghuensis]|uniref:Virulence sensor protein BvgS n=1 Tax=Paraburkholderia dinghuensis TaxID=2305225 RepID=A0A3N6N390_9BURK|nr:response regulator [Paraburkholderia dinghuensis]RQH08995.1 hybrid sensor histidine kinase/response regulator [Paraburkholderia dinghuensis]